MVSALRIVYVYHLIKLQYLNNCHKLEFSLFVYFASISHKKVGEQRISSGKAKEFKRSLRVCPFYRYTRLFPVTAQQITKKLYDGN